MSQKPSIPKGTRDFLPGEVAKRSYIFSTLQKIFKKYAFAPIETPSFEKRETLLGKYGEEGDRLIFRILNSGDKVKSADLKALQEENLPVFANSLSEKALRYDLTVPFARFVVQHQNELSFPFKRYQIQPVWRADRPQNGRYQEFYQCDADAVGSDSLLYEIECVQILDEALYALNIPDFTIKINNRKILAGIAEVSGEEDKLIDITVAIDKLDKIDYEGVVGELREKGVSEKAIQIMKPLFELTGSWKERVNTMAAFLQASEIGKKGIEELKFVLENIEEIGLLRGQVEFDVTLARGLNYYTGAIFEVKANGVNMGSICGGGRYDNLTELFGLSGMSGVGISFGADRIYDIMNELNLFPETLEKGTDLLFVNFGEKEQTACLKLLKQVRQNAICAEVYPSFEAKIKKQLKYADDKNIQFVALIGENELENQYVILKNMLTGEQITLSQDELIPHLQKQID